jgi:N-methylhydantoinase B
MHKDTLYLRWNGGGGVGDPLARVPASVGRDVVEGTISPSAALQVYGVVLDEGNVDEGATAQRRAARLRARTEVEA